MGHCNGCQQFIVQRYISFHSFIPWLTTSDTYVHTLWLQLARAKEVEQYSEQSCIPESLIVNSSKFYYQRSKEFIIFMLKSLQESVISDLSFLALIYASLFV